MPDISKEVNYSLEFSVTIKVNHSQHLLDLFLTYCDISHLPSGSRIVIMISSILSNSFLTVEGQSPTVSHYAVQKCGLSIREIKIEHGISIINQLYKELDRRNAELTNLCVRNILIEIRRARKWMEKNRRVPMD